MRPAFLCLLFLVFAVLGSHARAEPVEFNIPAQRADRALLAFSRQAGVEILFSSDQLRAVEAKALLGRYEPRTALDLLLRGTGFKAQPSGESKWLVKPTGPPTGTIKGKILAPDGSPARRVRVVVAPGHSVTITNSMGEFALSELAPGRYAVIASAPNCRPLQIIDVNVSGDQVTALAVQSLQRSEDPTRLEPFVVKGHATHTSPLDHSDAWLGARTAGGNLDLARTESDALPYMIFNRSQIARSGVVNLNEFLQRELIDSSPGTLPPEQNGGDESFLVGSAILASGVSARRRL